MSFPLFTSIRAPADEAELHWLHDCIVSWHRNGFHPIALNGPTEVAALKPLHFSADFAMLPSDGRPRIGAMLDVIRASGARVAGIINSDCRMIEAPGLAGRLAAAVAGSIATASRIDVDGDGRPTPQRGGFDAFFFDVAVLPTDDHGYRIGEPWWDHWFPLACARAGARVETLTAPLMVHRAHPERWSAESFIDAGRRFHAFLSAWRDCGGMPDTLAALIPAPDAGLLLPWLGRLSRATPLWLLHCQPAAMALLPPGLGGAEMMLRLAGTALLTGQYGTLAEGLAAAAPPPPASTVPRRRFRFPQPLRWLGNVPGKVYKMVWRLISAVQ